MSDDRLRDTAHDQPLDPGTSVGPDDDQVCLPFVGRVDDSRSRIALAYFCVDGQPWRRYPMAPLPRELLGVLRLTFPDLFPCRRSQDNLSGRRRVGLNH